MVVVQFFTANQDSPRYDIGARIFHLKGAVSEIVAYAVDHAGGRDRNPQHLYGPDGQTKRSEQQDVGYQHDGDATLVGSGVHVAFQPVIGGSMTIFVQRFLVRRFLAIKLATL